MQLPEEEQAKPGVSLVEIFFRAKELEKNGQDVIHFDAGEPDFGPPKQVVDATIEALKSGKSRYAESGGIPQARKAISDHLTKKYRRDISQKEVLVAAGGRLALYYAFLALPRKGKVGIITPDWPAYRDNARFLSMPTQFFRANPDDRWNLNLDEIRKSECSSLILNYPNNPTGKILDPKDFEEIVDIANEKNMILISDEVYSDYVLNESSQFKSILEYPDAKYLFTTSLSKSYAMTGFRAAYVVSDEKTIAELAKINGLILTSAPEFVQYSIIAALQCEEYVRDKVNLIKKRKAVAEKALRDYLGADLYPPDGSLYLFPKLSAKTGKFDSEKFAIELLENEYVSVTPGTSFGNTFREHIRMTLLQSEDRIEEGIRRMSNRLN